MNIDAGTMAPTEHGEVYVLNDGGETDLDLGNYERYLNISLGKDNNVTTGKVYQHVIDREVSWDPSLEVWRLIGIREEAIISARRCRSCPISRTRCRTGLSELLRSRWTRQARLRTSA